MPKILIAVALLFVASLNAQEISRTSTRLESEGFLGELYSPRPSSKQVVLVALGGAEGGVPTELADSFAREGFASLALAYFKSPGLPPELQRIPLEYVRKAVAWMAQRFPGERVVLLGWSKGAELALEVGSVDLRVAGVVAVSPSSMRWAGILKDWRKVPDGSWTSHGQPLPFVPFDASQSDGTLVSLYRGSLAAYRGGSAAEIEIEQIHGPVLLLSGAKDQVWPSKEMAEQLRSRHAAGKSTFSCVHLSYPDLGHLLDELFLKRDQVHPSRQAILAFLSGIQERPQQPLDKGQQ